MKKNCQMAGLAVLGLIVLGALNAPRAAAQDPVLTPIIAATAAPIVVNAVKPKPKNVGLVKFQGYFMHANTAQVTVRAMGNDQAIQTFSLGEAASGKMQK